MMLFVCPKCDEEYMLPEEQETCPFCGAELEESNG